MNARFKIQHLRWSVAKCSSSVIQKPAGSFQFLKVHSWSKTSPFSRPRLVKRIFWGLTLNAPIATKVVCFSRLLKCLRSIYGKQCGPRSDCSYRSSLFWVHAVCFYKFVSNVRQIFAADDFSRWHFQIHFFLGALRVNIQMCEKMRMNVRNGTRDSKRNITRSSMFNGTSLLN